MRKSAISAAAVVSSVALLVVGAPTASQAFTQKELSVCWNTVDDDMDFEFVADGPSYKTASLDNGDCTAWDVRPGQYKLTAEDVEKFIAGISKECDDYGTTHWFDTDGDGVRDLGGPGGADERFDEPDLSIKIKRQNDSYQAYTLAALLTGQVTTNVKKDRRTLFSVKLSCSQTPPDFGI